MLRVDANTIQLALAAHQFTFIAYSLNRGTNFHPVRGSPPKVFQTARKRAGETSNGINIFLSTEYYPSLVSIWAQFQCYLIADYYFYVVNSHLAGQIRQNLSAIIELNFEFRVGQGVYHYAILFYFLIIQIL